MPRVEPVAVALSLFLAGAFAEAGTFAERLASARTALELAAQLQRADPAAAGPALAVAEAALELAWLSGDYAYYGHARDAVGAAAAAPQAAPETCLVAARVHLTLHQVPAARDTLDRCSDWTDAVTRLQLQADAAFDAGQLGEAAALQRQALHVSGSVSALVRVANLHEAQGHPEEAKALFAEAERRDRSGDPAQQAWLKLRRAQVALHQGRWDEARAVYLAAADILPGWWLVEEHLAEVEALLGEEAAARQRYTVLVERTGLPGLMDSLAGLEARRGDVERAGSLRRAARRAHEARLGRFPEAAAGHALDHFLADDAALARALVLAEDQYRTRRNVTVAAAVARARWQAGQKQLACTAVRSARDAGFGSAEILWLGARCASLAGAAADAERLRQQALSINPRAAQMYGFDGQPAATATPRVTDPAAGRVAGAGLQPMGRGVSVLPAMAR